MKCNIGCVVFVIVDGDWIIIWPHPQCYQWFMIFELDVRLIPKAINEDRITHPCYCIWRKINWDNDYFSYCCWIRYIILIIFVSLRRFNMWIVVLVNERMMMEGMVKRTDWQCCPLYPWGTIVVQEHLLGTVDSSRHEDDHSRNSREGPAMLRGEVEVERLYPISTQTTR